MQTCTIEKISSLDNLLAKNLKIRRTLKGFSQNKLSKKTGIHQSLIAKIETCHRKMRASELQLFAESLEISISDFFNDSVQLEN